MLKIKLNSLVKVLRNFDTSILEKYQYALITKYSSKGLSFKYHYAQKQNFEQLSKLINKSSISQYLQEYYQMKNLNDMVKYVKVHHEDNIEIYRYYYQWLKQFADKYHLQIIATNSYDKKSLYDLYKSLYNNYNKIVSLAFSINLDKIKNPYKTTDLQTKEYIYRMKYQIYLDLEYLMISTAGIKLFKNTDNCPLLPLRIRYTNDNKFSKQLTLKQLCKYYKQYLKYILKYINQPQVMFNICYHFYNDINSMYTKFVLHKYNAIKFNSVNAYDITNFKIPSIRKRFRTKQYNLIDLGKQAVKDEKALINKNKWLVKLKEIPKINAISFPDNVSAYDMGAIWTSEDLLNGIKENLEKYNNKAYQLYCHYYQILKNKNIKPLHKELSDYNESPTNRLKLVKEMIDEENNTTGVSESLDGRNKELNKLKANWNNWNV